MAMHTNTIKAPLLEMFKVSLNVHLKHAEMFGYRLCEFSCVILEADGHTLGLIDVRILVLGKLSQNLRARICKSMVSFSSVTVIFRWFDYHIVKDMGNFWHKFR